MAGYKSVPVEGIPGVTTVDVPDDWSDEQIATALKAHPAYKNESGRALLRDAARERTLGFANEMAKGVPIVGNLADRYEEHTGHPYGKELQRDYPLTATGARIGGGLLSSAPIAGGVAASTGPGLIRNIMAQGGTFGGLGVADKIAEKGQEATPEDLAWSGGLNAIGGAAGPLIGRGFSPSLPRAPTHDELSAAFEAAARGRGPGPRYTKTDLKGTKDDPFGFHVDEARKAKFGHIADVLEDMEGEISGLHQPPSSHVLDTLVNTGTGAVAGGLAGHLGGSDAMLGSLAGGLLGSHVGPAVRSAVGNSAWWNNTKIHNHPNIQAILDALGPSIVSSQPPGEELPQQ